MDKLTDNEKLIWAVAFAEHQSRTHGMPTTREYLQGDRAKIQRWENLHTIEAIEKAAGAVQQFRVVFDLVHESFKGTDVVDMYDDMVRRHAYLKP